MVGPLALGLVLASAALAAPPISVVPPTGVVATALSTSAIRLTWLDPNDGESGYQIERSLQAGAGFTLISTVAANATSFTDQGLQAGTRYYYRLRAVEPGKGNKPDRYSDYSETVSAQTFAATTTTSSTSTSTSTSTSSSTSTTSAGNQAPVANAGPDQALAVGEVGVFDGRGSFDPDGTIVSYLWNFGDGGNWGNTAVVLRSYASAGTYTVTLYVQDNAGTWSADTLHVTVGGASTTSSTSTSSTTTTSTSTSTSTSSSTPTTSTTTSTIASNQPPVANAGPDRTLAVGQAGTFDGRASFDPDGTIVSYLWNFGDGGNWGTSAVVSRSYASAGTYTVTLYVKDDDGTWSSDTAVVTVGGASSTTSTTTSSTTSTSVATTTTSTSSSTSTTASNQAPVAKAGPDRQATVGQTLTFDGTASFDPDGQIAVYAWSFGDGATAGTAIAPHAYQAAGTYTVVLFVQDDRGAWSTDTAIVTVTDPAGGDWLGQEAGSSNQQSTGVTRTGTSDVAVVGFSNGTAVIGGITLAGQTGRLDGYAAKYGATGMALWARQLAATSTSGMVIPEAVAGDGSGNVVVAGRFAGAMRAGNVTLASAGGQDIFVAKYGATGTLQWARRFGGGDDDAGYGVGTDSQGDVYVTGFYTGAVDFGGGVLQENKITPGPTLFVLKLTGAGTHAWSRSFAGTASEFGYGLAVAPNGDIVVGGSFSERLDLGGGQFRTFGVTDGFIVQLSPTGAHRWSRQVGGSSFDDVLAVATDANGNVGVTGRFRGSATFGGGTFSTTPTVSDMFVASYTAGGVYRWARTGGSTFAEDVGLGIAFDGAGNVCIAGSFMDTATFSTGTVTSAGGRDAFLVEYGPSGSYLGVDAWGGSGNDEALAVAAWGTGQVGVAGFFRDTAVVAGQVITSQGGSDGFTARVSR